jgi:hypothetical protein
MNVIRFIAPALVCVATASPAFGDVTLKSKMSGAGMSGETTQQFKGSKLRIDQIMGPGRQVTTIIDAGLRQMISVDHQSKQAEVIDMATIGQAMEKIGATDIKSSVTPTGQTRQIAGSTCAVYDVQLTVPIQVASQTMTMVLSGPQCIVKNGPGHAEILAFYKAASDKGFFFDAAQAKANPAAAKAMAEMQKKMADLGVPFATETKIGMQVDGPMAEMMKKMGSTFSTEVTSVSTAPVPDSQFEIPAGYKVNKR